MKIKLTNETWNNYWLYNMYTYCLNQKQFDYICKYLDFDKLYKNKHVYFENHETSEWFHETYTNSHYLEYVYKKSPEGYEWLKENWGNGVFKSHIYYADKQELKTIVNKIINIKLIKG